MRLCWKKVFFFLISEPSFVYIFDTIENFSILIFSRERTAKNIRKIYNIPRNIFISKEKITFNFVKKNKMTYFQVFFAYLQNYMEFYNIRLFFVKERQKFFETKYYCVK